MLDITIIKKHHSINGNPIYTILIPYIKGKIKGLRKLKTPYMYSFTSYNIKSYLEWVFPKDKLNITNEV